MSNVGFRVFTQIERPDKVLVEQFRDLPVANIADEMNRISCVDARIKPVNSAPLLGSAFTVKVRVGDNLMLHTAIDMAMPGDVIIVDAQGNSAKKSPLAKRLQTERGIGRSIRWTPCEKWAAKSSTPSTNKPR